MEGNGGAEKQIPPKKKSEVLQLQEHKKRLSHPDIRVTSSSRRSSGQENHRTKKFSLASQPMPTLRSFTHNGSKHYGHDEEEEEEEEEDVTKSLETAVRKISRGNSPNPLRSSPNMFSSGDLRIGGLSGLARGYEQYRESLTFLRPMVEFGEASSDDLSSEWESSSSDVENNNNNNNNSAFGRQMKVVASTAASSSSPANPGTVRPPASTISSNSSARSPPPSRKFPLDLPPISQSKVSQAKTRVREKIHHICVFFVLLLL